MKHQVISTGNLLKTWKPFRDVLDFSAVRTKKDYARATAVVDVRVQAVRRITY